MPKDLLEVQDEQSAGRLNSRYIKVTNFSHLQSLCYGEVEDLGS